ncbi:Ring-h2 finger protein atl43 [Thalictrum thalictroides]|uniref:RING-type E3 ubiquitin transferase n=1 Tax=Thalictrum thalictroides TaxID=46969 RepID=A0A7J6UTG5_THATH|nr:Ring-h2 finger protein atl43 [Thalictrum thalictroides]
MEFLRGFRFWVFFILFWGICFSPQITANSPQTSNQSSSSPPPSSSSSPLLYKENATSFRPSIAIIVAVLTTMFSITFLLLLYAKHCKANRSNGYHGNLNSIAQSSSSTARRNSGIDRSVIESLPVFRFASLRGQKEGLECSVCLNRFESNEILRLLPKCKHAFHVECVDTWLDAHSTCPLCRYRVDPEDVLLIEVDKEFQRINVEEGRRSEATELEDELTRRISGRHSSAGERISNFLQILVQRPGELTQKNDRRSVDSAISRKINQSVTVGCFDRGVRKDGLLLSETTAASEAQDRENFLKRFDHQIILSTESGSHKRWSELRPSDLLFLQSEMIISNSGRYSLSSHRQKTRVAEQQQQQKDLENGRDVINTRSVSEITGLSRYANKTEKVGPRYQKEQQ